MLIHKIINKLDKKELELELTSTIDFIHKTKHIEYLLILTKIKKCYFHLIYYFLVLVFLSCPPLIFSITLGKKR
jgi:hypothetical protein